MIDQTDDDQPVSEIPSGRGEILFYQTEDGGTRVACRFEDESIWLSQALMVELFQTSKQNISLHLKNVFDEGELDPDRVVKDYLTTAADDQARRRKQVFMSDWEEKLDAFLAFNDRRVLPDAGKVTRKAADAFASHEYEAFAERRRSFKETEGERAAMQALEQLARDLPEQRDEPDGGSET